MAVIRLADHSTSKIFEAIKQMVQAHGFVWNDDLSETEVGSLKKEFKIVIVQVLNTDRSNRQNFRVRATIEVILYHNAEGNTDAAQVRAYDDIENLVFELERFSPTGAHMATKMLVAVTNLQSWTTEAIKVGDDSRLRSVLEYEIEYIIKNPAA